MKQLVEYIYVGHDNTIELVLRSDNVAIEHHSITRVKANLVGPVKVTLDSNNNPSWFDFSDPTKLTMGFGPAAIPKGNYQMTLIVYLPTKPNGLVWGQPITVIVY